jgi:hypothetical protein
MSLYADIERFRATQVLPFGTCAGDQDALFWQARDAVNGALGELQTAMGGAS